MVVATVIRPLPMARPFSRTLLLPLLRKPLSRVLLNVLFRSLDSLQANTLTLAVFNRRETEKGEKIKRKRRTRRKDMKEKRRNKRQGEKGEKEGKEG